MSKEEAPAGRPQALALRREGDAEGERGWRRGGGKRLERMGGEVREEGGEVREEGGRG